MHRMARLDGLRALAVLLVFAHHIDQSALPGGFIGVDVFFVLSGYLITRLLLLEFDRNGFIDLRRFYARRALRLWPALSALAAITAVAAVGYHIGTIPIADNAAALVYLTDFWVIVKPELSLVLHTWSLAVEEQFYLVWPAILIWALMRHWRRGLQHLVWALIAVSLLITAALGIADIHRVTVQFLPTSHVAELGTGALLAMQQRTERVAWARRLSSAWIAVTALCLLVAAEIWLPADWWAFPACTIACWPIVAHLVLHEDSRISHLFAARPAVWLGERSYGFYLWHYPIIILLATHGVHTWEEAAIALPITLAMTVLSWELLEKPILRFKQRFAVRGVTEPLPVDVPVT
jgi:peptidoglycan/LPS O-acetylase OafA/YrhL